MMSKSERSRPLPPPNCGPESRAVETWVRLALAEKFDPVLAEALPAEMLAALAQTH